MNEIIKRVFTRQMCYKGYIILTYQIEYPEIVCARGSFGRMLFNEENRRRALELREYTETELFKQAKELYEYNQENGYPIMQYEVMKVYEITYCRKNIISLYTDTYFFTGGAHGNTIRHSQNWNLETGQQMALACFYPQQPEYLLILLRDINEQIKGQLEQNPGIYFDNYCELVLDTFKVENYYITESDIVIFFQQYDIAPYSTGIPTFSIPRK